MVWSWFDLKFFSNENSRRNCLTAKLGKIFIFQKCYRCTFYYAYLRGDYRSSMVLEKQINVFLKPSVFQQIEQSRVSKGKRERKKYVTMKDHINNNVKQWDPLLRNLKIPLVFNWIMNCEVRETNNNNFPKIIHLGSLLEIKEIHSPLDVGNHC